MFMEAGIDGAFTNHSLRATAATVVSSRCTWKGHSRVYWTLFSQSTSAIWVAVTQQRAASNILNGTSLQDHDGEIETVTINKCSDSQPSPNNIASLLFQMPSFSPILNNNSKGTINFTVNICPSRTLYIGKAGFPGGPGGPWPTQLIKNYFMNPPQTTFEIALANLLPFCWWTLKNETK